MNLFYFMQAEMEKELGNEAYKKKDFETALKHYEKAAELDATNITYLTNKSGNFIKQFNTETLNKS